MPAAAVPVIWQLVKVATPATAEMVGNPVFEHASVPAPGPELTARVTLPVSLTTLPLASSTLTTGEVVKFVPSVTLPTGSVVKTNWLADPTLITTLEEVPVVSPLRVAFSV